MNKRFWTIIAVITVLFLAFLWLGGNENDKQEDKNTQTTITHVKGNAASKVKLVEYGDFQCPVCAAYYPAVQQVYEKYKDRIAFQFRHLPLSQVHPNAFAAARAAEAASLQGKFWEMHDFLYASQSQWSSATNPRDNFRAYAKQLGLDASKFDDDFVSSKVNKSINSDIGAFKKTGNPLATPTFFLNDKKIELKQLTNDQSQPQLDKFSALIDKALKEQ